MPDSGAIVQKTEHSIDRPLAGDTDMSILASKTKIGSPTRQLLDLERDLRESIRGGYLFGEPLDAYGLRIVRVIQQRLSDLPCECVDRTPDIGGYRCRACGRRLLSLSESAGD